MEMMSMTKSIGEFMREYIPFVAIVAAGFVIWAVLYTVGEVKPEPDLVVAVIGTLAAAAIGALVIYFVLPPRKGSDTAGFGRPKWVVRAGELMTQSGKTLPLGNVSGPGTILVQEGHALVFEMYGKLSRVVGSGLCQVKRDECLGMIVPLYARTEKLVVARIVTKDKLLIDEMEIVVFHKVDPGPAEKRIRDDQFTYSEDIIIRNVWEVGGRDWRDGIRFLAEMATRDVVGRYDLEELVPLSDAFRSAFRVLLKDAINKVSLPFMGVMVISVDVGHIDMPKEARDKYLEKYLAYQNIGLADTEGQAAISRAETGAKIEETKAKAEAAVALIRAEAEQKQMKLGAVEARRKAPFRRGESDAGIVEIKAEALAEAQETVIENLTSSFQQLRRTAIDSSQLMALLVIEMVRYMTSSPMTSALLPERTKSQLEELESVASEIADRRR
jgi:regulator of protease activity HflC (stomatin/prohibitin superfamily)